MPKRPVVFKCFVTTLCVCFLTALLSAAVLEAAHEEHTSGFDAHCAVCAQIRDAQSTLKRLLLVWACCGLLFAGIFRPIGGLEEAAAIAARADTPVACKVRLNS